MCTSCRDCGAPLPPRPPGQTGRPRVYCGPACSKRFRRRSRSPEVQPDARPRHATPARACEGCGGIIPPGSHPARKWCSRTCGATAKRAATGAWTRKDAGRRACMYCGDLFVPRSARSAYCQPQHGWLHRARMRPKSEDWLAGRRPERIVACLDCGEGVVTRGSTVCCEGCRAERKRATNRRKNVKRRGAKVGISYTLREIGDRDGWKCHLCRRAVDRTLPGTHRRGPTVDHLVPIAAGGEDRPANVALAHRSCNVARRDKGTAQLRLVG